MVGSRLARSHAGGPRGRALAGGRGRGSPVLPVALLIIGTNALIAMLLPYTAESFPLRIRGRTTGVVAACTKAGGMFAQLLAILALIPPLSLVSLVDHGADCGRADPGRMVRQGDAGARSARARSRRPYLRRHRNVAAFARSRLALYSKRAMMEKASTLLMFGATGDLARRMLLPSLYGLDSDGLLPDDLRIIGTARTELDDDGFRASAPTRR